MNEETRDEAQGLGASDQADGAVTEPKGEPTEVAEAPAAEPTGEESGEQSGD